MNNYFDGYYKGMSDKAKGMQMDLPDAVNNADGFKGYFDGYRWSSYKPPSKSQAILKANLKKFNFTT